jgi:hypothetical protein
MNSFHGKHLFIISSETFFRRHMLSQFDNKTNDWLSWKYLKKNLFASKHEKRVYVANNQDFKRKVVIPVFSF